MITRSLTSHAEDVEQMQKIEVEVATVLRKYRSNTEAAILAIALVRIARAILAKYEAPAKRDLIDVCIEFLNGGAGPLDDPAAKILTMQ